jgi:hypothetical protein
MSEKESELLKAATVTQQNQNLLYPPSNRPVTPRPKDGTPKGKPNICPYCNEKFTDVTRHFNTMHTPQKDVQCKSCDPVGIPPKRPTFETKHELKMHNEKFHPK